MIVVIGLWTLLRAWLLGSTTIALENLALRHQLRILQRTVVRPRLSRRDRILWVWLSRGWTDWRSSLVIVQPATVLVSRRERADIAAEHVGGLRTAASSRALPLAPRGSHPGST